MNTTTFFAPHLALTNVLEAILFCQQAFDAKELRRWSNPDGTVHVAEMEIDGALFHLHEETLRIGQVSPLTSKTTTLLIGLFVADPDKLMQQAVAAGATVISPMQDFDYGYRQGVIADPCGHQWMLQKKI